MTRVEQELILQTSSVGAAVIFLFASVFWLMWLDRDERPGEAKLADPNLPNFPQSPNPGMGLVYVVRPTRLAGMTKFGLQIDGAQGSQAVKIGGRRYVALPAAPGDHRLIATTLGCRVEIPFRIEAGQTQTFAIRAAVGVLWWRISLVPMEQRAARFFTAILRAQ